MATHSITYLHYPISPTSPCTAEVMLSWPNLRWSPSTTSRQGTSEPWEIEWIWWQKFQLGLEFNIVQSTLICLLKNDIKRTLTILNSSSWVQSMHVKLSVCTFQSKLDWTKHAARDICRPVDAPNVHLLISLQGFRPSGCFPSLFFRSTKPNRYKSILPIHQWWFKHVDGSNLDNYSNMVYSLKKMPMHPVVTGWLIPCPNLWLSPWSFQSAICWGWPKIPAGDRGHERVFDFQPASRTGSRLTQQPGHAVLSAVFLWNVQVQWTTTNKLMPP